MKKEWAGIYLKQELKDDKICINNMGVFFSRASNMSSPYGIPKTI
jgi:hypothetical protein|tara:strand:+ start:454 stop:588 length:135 start_codon:yes stop_codon:yes gene_type:complete